MFRHDVIKAATNNFDSSNELGAGGFGTVYKGQLPDGTLIAVKQISIHSKQGFAEFINEIGLITVLRHPNLVRLYGFCNEEMMCLIYEYMENNSLSRALYGINSSTLKAKLTWPVRLKICIGIAKGLIIHRDIKTRNVLLDEKFNAKISDFGLAKLYDQDENTGKKTKFAGTLGYAAPEYAIQGFLSKQTDVYSFGIVGLEIVSGKSISYLHNEESRRLLEWAWQLRDDECLVELVDSDLTNSESTQNAALICTEALTVLNVALLCTEASAVRRPTISEALEMLEGRRTIEAFTKEKGFSIVDHKNGVIRDTHCFRNPSERRPMTSEPHTESFVTTELS